jgi:hypothetical protein
MGAATEDFDDWPFLRRAWLELDLPGGWKTEVVAGTMALSPPPDRRHDELVDDVTKAFTSALPAQWSVHQRFGMLIAGEKRIYRPDVVVLPPGAPVECPKYVLSSHALLVAEITAKDNPAPERTAKTRAYARGGVAVYLLVDPWDEPGPRVTVFSEPARGTYHRSVTWAFGARIRIPSPVDVELDSGSFR